MINSNLILLDLSETTLQIRSGKCSLPVDGDSFVWNAIQIVALCIIVIDPRSNVQIQVDL
jgi:hypothetical protein